VIGRLAVVIAIASTLVAPVARADGIHTDFHAGDDPAITSSIVNSLAYLTWTFPELRDVAVDTESLTDTSYAQAGDGKITFNTRYTGSASQLDAMIAQNAQIGFHPKLGRCSGAQLLTFHEAAHIIDAAKGGVPSQALAALYGDGHDLRGQLSGYSFKNGLLNPPEALAEGFASTLCNGGNAIERGIYRLVAA
jgi:hypothetical protein